VSLAQARAVADAVLFEGYVLYPYRASAPKNRARWQFGVVAPRAWSDAGGTDPWWLETCCLLEGEDVQRLSGTLRFLQLERRRIEVADLAAPGGFRAVDSLEVGGQLHVAWDEARLRELELRAPLESGAWTLVYGFPGGTEVEPLVADGVTVGRIVRESVELAGSVRVTAEAVPATRPLRRLRVRIENTSTWSRPAATRDEAMVASLLGTHLLLSAPGGSLLSMIDPPAFAAQVAAASRSVGLHPVLVGEPGAEVLLAAPIILSDHPAIAPESPGDFYDASEIDEILTLRTLTLTDEEKREVRATDPRAAAILDRVEQLPPEVMARLHGAVRSTDPIPLGPGSRVRLRPGPRRTDAQDMFLQGKLARVEAALEDVDGRACYAVTVDDDPASELFRVHGRYLYFYADELEPA
jgi:hypothetical protein